MKSNLLLTKIVSIQNEYKELLTALLPKLQSAKFPEALDEINLFWIRHINVVHLYLKSMFHGKDSYVFTAATYMDFDDGEHLPFLLLGDRHVLDDPLSKYSEICNKMPESHNAELLYKQIGLTAEDNLKILENVKNNIFILPLRLLNQSNVYEPLFKVGEQTFISLFKEIESLKDYFEKCNSIEDIIKYAREDIGNLVMFSEYDDCSLSFEKRYKNALAETQYMVDTNKADSYNFYMLVFGCIQQAIDVIISCVEYDCIPYIRYPVTLHYISLLSGNMQHIDHIIMLRYRMSVAFVVYKLCDKNRLAKVSLDEYLDCVQKYGFNKRLFDDLEKNGINEHTFLNHTITNLVKEKLEEFYNVLTASVD